MRCSACAADLPERSRFCFQCAAPVAESGKNAPGDLAAVLGDRYRIVRLLGRGGMGAVHLARENALDRMVAIKTLPTEGEAGAEAHERFRREARTAARLNHPGIVALHAFGDTGGTPYYVMGYVRGESLAARLGREGRIDADETRQLLASVADALDYAHRQGVVHRDVKPDNVLLDDDTGRPMLADFGIAKGGAGTMTGTGGVIGTPHYMAPEQAAGRPVDGRSDLYALGVMGFRMLTGRLPFEGATVQETLVRRLTEDAPRVHSVAPEVPADLAAAIDRCLARDPAARWPDGRALREALALGASGPPAELTPELQDAESLAFWAVPAAIGLFWIASLWLASLPPRDYSTAERDRQRKGFLLGVAVLAGWPLPRLIRAARSGARASTVARVAARPPLGWLFWYPGAWRRPGDVWSRLPARIRRFRAAATLTLVYALAVLTAVALLIQAVVSEEYDARLNNLAVFLFLPSVFSFPLFAVVMMIQKLRLTRWARAQGVDEEEAHRLVLGEPTAWPGFWSRPGVAKLLEEDATPVPVDPRACVALLSSAARSRSGPARTLADEALVLGRKLLAQMEAWDAEMQRGGGRTGQLERIEADLDAMGGAPSGPEQQRLRALLTEQAELLRAVRARHERLRANRGDYAAVLARLVKATREDPRGSSGDAARRVLADAAVVLGGADDTPTAAVPSEDETETRVR